jgi:ABC-2 type transport system ATP-binding protein
MKETLMPYRVLEVEFAEPAPRIDLPDTELLEVDENCARLRFNRHKVSASELIVALAGRYPVKDISVEEPEIEAIVRGIYQRSSSSDSLSERNANKDPT